MSVSTEAPEIDRLKRALAEKDEELRELEDLRRYVRVHKLAGTAGDGLIGFSQRLPPANLEAEQALLGAIMANNKAFDRVREFLRPEHFLDPIHQRIYRAITHRIEANQLADAVTLRSEFENSGEMDEVGGPHYLAKLLSAMTGIINAGEYGQVILDAWMRRQLIDLGESAVNEAFRPQGTDGTERLMSRVRDGLTVLEGVRASDGTTVPFRVAVRRAIDRGYEVAARGTGLSGISCGIPSIDKVTMGLEPGTNTVIAARPGVGKTVLGLQTAIAMARLGFRIPYFSLEMPAAQLARRALSMTAEIPLRDLRSGAFAATDAGCIAITRAEQELADLPILIEDQPGLTYQQVRDRVLAARRKMGRVDAIIIDHFHILGRDERLGRLNDTQALAEQSRHIRAIGRNMGIPLITLMQLNRGPENREDKRPTIADLRGSGAIEQDADTIAFIYRPEMYLKHDPERKVQESDTDYARRLDMHHQRKQETAGKAFLFFEKVRDGEQGAEVVMRFDAQRVRFVELDQG